MNCDHIQVASIPCHDKPHLREDPSTYFYYYSRKNKHFVASGMAFGLDGILTIIQADQHGVEYFLDGLVPGV